MPKQVFQDISTGITRVEDIATPLPRDKVIVAVAASAISAGTERYVVDLAAKSLFAKAVARPDHVRRIIQKIRQEGLWSTFGQVQSKLAEPMPLGYSAAGTVLDCGAGIRQFRPGDRVAVAAPHAAVVAVTPHQCARIPENVSFEQAAYASIASIALQGVRLAKVTLGERVLVIGTGLIGLMAIGLLRAQGCHVIGLDVSDQWFGLAQEFGAEEILVGLPADQVMRFSKGQGVDATLITAATTSNEPIEFAAEMSRQRGRIVLVGTAGLDIPRKPFFEKELEFTVSHSMGPGRGDREYESKGFDYPIGQVRWTMQRNMEAVLDQMSVGRLPLDRLTTHHFAVDDAPHAYTLLREKTEPYLGIVVDYPASVDFSRRIENAQSRPSREGLKVSLIGAGNFARLVLLPLLAKHSSISLRGVCTEQGLPGWHVADRHSFQFSTTDPDAILEDPETDAVFVLTRHNTHSKFVTDLLMS